MSTSKIRCGHFLCYYDDKTEYFLSNSLSSSNVPAQNFKA